MKKVSLLLLFLLLVLSVTGCGGSGITISLGGSEPAANQQTYPLQAVIDAPVSGSTLAMGPIDISYHATSQEGVAAVELSVDGAVLSNMVTPDSKQQLVALKYTWQPTAGGTHVLRVRAQSSKGTWSNYAEAMVNIQAPAQQQNQQQQQQQQEQQQQQQSQPAAEEPEGVEITNIDRSVTRFYRGANTCGPIKLTITITASHAEKIFQVVIFNRLWDNEGGGLGPWDSGYAMKPLGSGEYTFTYTETNVRNPRGFEFSTFYYQFVIKGKANEELYRSEVFKDLSFHTCK